MKMTAGLAAAACSKRARTWAEGWVWVWVWVWVWGWGWGWGWAWEWD